MARASDTILKITWALAAAIFAFTAENLWIDPWLQRKSHHKLPPLVPGALSGAWFLISLALFITVIFLVVSQVLLMRDATVPKRKKMLTGIFVAAGAILSGIWFVATSGTTLATRSAAGAPQKRSVALRWQASTTPNVRYNVYRGQLFGIYPDKLNEAPLDGLTFTDTTVQSGMTYFYAVRAVDAKGEQSAESNEARATIP